MIRQASNFNNQLMIKTPRKISRARQLIESTERTSVRATPIDENPCSLGKLNQSVRCGLILETFQLSKYN